MHPCSVGRFGSRAIYGLPIVPCPLDGDLPVVADELPPGFRRATPLW